MYLAMLLPERLPLEPLGSLAEVVGGGTPPSTKPEYFTGDIPWLTPKDLSGHRGRFVYRGSRSLSRAGLKRSGARMLPVGAVLVSSRAPVGYMAIAGNPLATNQGFRSLVIRGDGIPGYYYYALRARRSVLLRHANGTTFPELGTRALQEIEIPVASLAIQRSLVECFDPIDDKEICALRLAERLIHLGRALFLRVRKEASRHCTLGELGDLIGGRTPPTSDPSLWSGGHPWATPKDLTRGKLPFLEPTERTLTAAGIQQVRGAVAPAGSILLATRATIGAVTMATHSVAFNQGCTAFVPEEPSLQHYMFHELALRIPYIESLATGTTFLEVGKGALREMLISLPRQELLDELSRDLQLIHERAESLMREASRLQALRDGLLSQMFVSS